MSPFLLIFFFSAITVTSFVSAYQCCQFYIRDAVCMNSGCQELSAPRLRRMCCGDWSTPPQRHWCAVMTGPPHHSGTKQILKLQFLSEACLETAVSLCRVKWWAAVFVCPQAPRLQPEVEFVQALMNIGKKLQNLPTKELRSEWFSPPPPPTPFSSSSFSPS